MDLNPKIKYIRENTMVYIRNGALFCPYQDFPSISKAKRFTNELEKKEPGSVRRYESLLRDLGPIKIKELFE